MKPVEFPEVNIVYAKDQPEYIPLPGHKVNDDRGEFIFCMSLSFKRTIAHFVYWQNCGAAFLTFNKPLTPSLFSTRKKDLFA
jgi:hypothetical protein